MTFRKRCLAAFLLTANAVLVVSACAPHRSASPGRTCKTGLAKPGKVLVRYTVEGGAKTADAGQGLGDDVMTDRYREVIVFRDGRLIVRDGLRTARILRLPGRQLAAIGGDLERACFARLRRAYGPARNLGFNEVFSYRGRTVLIEPGAAAPQALVQVRDRLRPVISG